MTNYGTVVAGMLRLTITHMGIRDGFIQLSAVRSGPFPAYSGPIEILGHDGVPLKGVPYERSHASWPEIPSLSNLVFPITLSPVESERPGQRVVLQGAVESEPRAIAPAP